MGHGLGEAVVFRDLTAGNGGKSAGDRGCVIALIRFGNVDEGDVHGRLLRPDVTATCGLCPE